MAKKNTEKEKLTTIIHNFINFNSLVIVGLIGVIAFHQFFIVGATVNSLESQQEKMVKYLKENVQKVYFLSANGQIITAKKSGISYSDDRFKQYMSNTILDNLIGGSIWLSKNGKIVYHKPEDLITKNDRINYFYINFIKPNGSVIAPYIKGIYSKLSTNKLPEYLTITSAEYEQYATHKPNENNNYKHNINAILKVRVIVKSWIPDIKRWDTREVPIRVRYSAVIDPVKYAKGGNPWGILFTNLEIPILVKPTARSIVGDN